MIVRAWWPLQAWLGRRRLPTWIALVTTASTVAAAAGLTHSPRLVAVAGGAALAVACGARGLAGALAAIAVVALALGTAALAGDDARTMATVAVIAALVVAPVVTELRGRDPSLAQHTAGRATGFAWLALQFANLGAVASGCWPAAAACLVLAVAITLPLVGCVLAPAGVAKGPTPLPTMMPAGWGERLAPPVILVAATMVSWPLDPRTVVAGSLDLRGLAPLLLAIAGLWGAATLRPLVALATLGGLVAGLAAADFMKGGGQPDPLALSAAQAVPVLLWRQRDALGGGWPPSGAAIAVLVIAGWCVPGWLPALAGSAGVALALALVPEPARVQAADALGLTRGALASLDPSWRCYGWAKLAYDPLYRRLAGDARGWGRVLDLGCGPGLVAALAAGRADVTAYLGIDLDLDKLLVARRLLRRCGRELDQHWGLLHGQLPLSQPLAGRFDTVLVLDVLHYAPVATQGALLAQARAMLADDGRLLMRDGMADAAGDAGRVGRGERLTTALGLNPGGGLHFLDEATMRGVLAASGFAIIACEPCGGENRLWTCRALNGVTDPD